MKDPRLLLSLSEILDFWTTLSDVAFSRICGSQASKVGDCIC